MTIAVSRPAVATPPSLGLDRVVSDALLAALAPGGPLHGVVTWRNADPSMRDVQLRRQPKGSASWASLYLGLTSVLDVYERGGRFHLKAARSHQQAGQFQPAWLAWQSLESLAARWPDVEQYLERVVGKVGRRWTDSEGRTHSLIASSADLPCAVINREASLSFVDQPTKDRLFGGWVHDVQARLSTSRIDEPWWSSVQRRPPGTSPDFIGVDDAGRLLVVEAKPAEASDGIVAAPVQVAVYAQMYAAWLAEAGSEARTVLHAMAQQRHALGLEPVRPRRSLAEPPPVVPVVAVGHGTVSPEVWGRMADVADAVGSAPGVEPLEVWRLTPSGSARPVDLGTAKMSPPADTQADVDASTYEHRARAAAVAWKSTTSVLPDDARADGPYRGNLYPFCLPIAHAQRNLLPEAQDAVDFFRARRIQWHRGIDGGPTNHLVSYEVQCVNALFPMTQDAELLKRAFADLLPIDRVIQLDGAHLTFEFNGGSTDYLREARDGAPLTRGANSTSTDAALAYATPSDALELALVEWKYTEKYAGNPLSPDPAGRRQKYRAWYEHAGSPFDTDAVPFDDVLVEPLYQLVRQQLLAWRMEEQGPWQRVVVLHIAPHANDAYERSLDRHGRRLEGESVRDVWKRMLRPAFHDRFHRVDSARFTDPARALTSGEYRARYGHT